VSGGYHYISAKGNKVDVFDANGSGKPEEAFLF
jgi:hypothetical protein